MVLSKRERVIRTLELNEEPDIIPIHTLGFETTAPSFQIYIKSKEKQNSITKVENKFRKGKYDITEQRFWNVDVFNIDPWILKFKPKSRLRPGPPEYPDCLINIMNGKLIKIVNQVDTGLSYNWYINGYFTKPEILYSYWDRYGKPSTLINERLDFSPKRWEGFVEALSPYFYPMATLPVAPHEWLFEGMTMGRVAYYMRKNPKFIHEVMAEYAKINVEIVKRLSEAGVEITFMYDDLGFRGGTIFSLENFRRFILPYYKQIYQECKKNGMFIVQHSCGNITEFLPDMINAGLNCIQALEPAAGVDLASLKKTFGDKISLMGGMDSSRVLNFGTPKDVEEDVKKCIKAAGYNGGYFAGPSHNILHAPWENILALRAALEKYRKYPLDF